MSSNMLGVLVRKIVDLPPESLGTLCDLTERLGGNEGKRWLEKQKKFLREGLMPVEKKTELVLQLIGTVVVPATTEKFEVRDKFVIDTSRKAKVKISYRGDNFQSWFLGKIEEPAAETELRYAKLLQSVNDSKIRSEIGEAFEETTLSRIFSLMELQPNGEKGVLLTDGRANIFYARDKNGVLRAVDVGWSGGGWDVGARSVEGPDGWGGGGRVFSRNSCRTL